MLELLHTRSDFNEVLSIVAQQRGIAPVLVEKDYWIMHCLWGLQQSQFQFELKGGTSLSKGFGIIHRFSEDIDIRIEPPIELQVKAGRNHDKPAHVESRRAYYDWLSQHIRISGIEAVQRDTAFDDEKMRSAGIRLHYPNRVSQQSGIKDGILLELGFDDTTPNRPVTISSWAYDAAVNAGVKIQDNRAIDVPCYLPTYTFVEKLQAVSTKYRLQKLGKAFPANFMRHYYDIYCLLALPEIQGFIGTPAYEARKIQRFPKGDELVAAKNSAFLLDDYEERARFKKEYQKTAALYYNGQPELEEILSRIGQFIGKM
ncbi:nucleotidyl transferase AbiEii/AbiGii toxin family protein [Undibacterium parvum]|uniref:Nucleotidyl transferase AbiEii/AbiGii toxin family protein n=2 Tax=Undibacterium TaxID=401469 RepID=A0A6M4A3Q7_9BURK|nr:nucleotidyl transferase AbiEii/AbiGii toxin family protein [Undibacterium parvum]AZP11199.1 nucleotidyl transferase AbiEii/AbiGii toxin family protein [Undibacterium parvum]QJQ05723.1 nucleotidyl transferase AbiEii/AbiGii toxin family protein [Undibacterium piscinae]